ncbi:ABC transporter ATP-binding protein [Zongyangia hominis]|uniref:ABC transporter ATP-binding protein n=1 Tax=Zongyangia hominis TaxID=2763677 RepID=A0A926EBZ8_9FIRM|nr:ABC transporter ATP-binding protein [Zongyangia hominis]MBC8571102.1 ABC transporter ATP-binding protein [Zongyangia hominis]
MTGIAIEGLTKRFRERTAVDDLHLSIGEGELFALLGQNGAGKTTTIRMLCGLCAPTSGDARLNGRSIVRETGAVKEMINVSPQETAVAPKLSVRENLVFMAQLYGASQAQANERADEMLAAFSLADRAQEKTKALSGGMQRRLSIAMALISEPRILFLDEPTLGLDVRARRDLWKLIEGLKGKITIVLTTHYLEEAAALADRIGIMHEGRMRVVGTVEEIERQTGAATLEEAFLQLTDTEEVSA